MAYSSIDGRVNCMYSRPLPRGGGCSSLFLACINCRTVDGASPRGMENKRGTEAGGGGGSENNRRYAVRSNVRFGVAVKLNLLCLACRLYWLILSRATFLLVQAARKKLCDGVIQRCRGRGGGGIPGFRRGRCKFDPC